MLNTRLSKHTILMPLPDENRLALGIAIDIMKAVNSEKEGNEWKLGLLDHPPTHTPT